MAEKLKWSTAKRQALARYQEILRQALPELRGRYGVREIGIFGSYVTGKARRGSDLDLLVDFDRAPSLFRLVELELDLSERLGIKVDLVMKDSLKPALRQRILQEVVGL
ncbi:MAG TPA: nucleotidyltransferase family protein [Chloroflexota bacterium]|nr:nucleotidyltransferase family protein [Chloroflexota bacterium]